MPKKHKVKDGECISSLAFQYDFFPETIWNHAENSQLKQLRKDPNILFPSDIVHIPDKTQKEHTTASDKRHRFRRKGVPEVLRVRFLKSDETPRIGVLYLLEVTTLDATLVHYDPQKTDGGGWLNETIPPDAISGKITLDPYGIPEIYSVQIGKMNPIDEMSGVQARLNNLGYGCGDNDGKHQEKTQEALRRFQEDHHLTVTGEINTETRDTLKTVHKS